jgi:hypothetical protein
MMMFKTGGLLYVVDDKFYVDPDIIPENIIIAKLPGISMFDIDKIFEYVIKSPELISLVANYKFCAYPTNGFRFYGSAVTNSYVKEKYNRLFELAKQYEELL